MSFFPNKLLLNILACGLVLSCPLQGATNGTETKESWKTFTSSEDGFSVELPAEPEHVEQTIEIPKTDLKIDYNTYLSEPSENVVYVISVWNYPSQIDMSKPEVNLQDGFGGMLSALPGSEVADMQMSEVQGFKALEFQVKNEDIFFQGKLILVNNTLYQVFTVYKNTEDMSQNYERFMDSFKLLNPEKRKAAPANGSQKKLNV
ncbi:MAG: hypothetical protein S4CHLAM2_00800 [Chlamydiales bacterium]|nr:hypothetical protein [Chlamydiales bacterium]